MGPEDELMPVLRRLGLVGEAEDARVTPLTGGVSSDILKVETPRRVFAVKRALPKEAPKPAALKAKAPDGAPGAAA